MLDNRTPDQKQPGFTILPADKEFVARICQLIPMEHADKEALGTLIAGHREMHSNASPNAQLERALRLTVQKQIAANRVIHNLVTQLGGTATVRDDDIPFDWSLELTPVEEGRTLTIAATRCDPPKNQPLV